MCSSTIPQAQLADYPDFSALVLNVLLFKLGGQITLPIAQLGEVAKDYPKIRIAFNPSLNVFEQAVTLTLISAENTQGGIHG